MGCSCSCGFVVAAPRYIGKTETEAVNPKRNPACSELLGKSCPERGNHEEAVSALWVQAVGIWKQRCRLP